MALEVFSDMSERLNHNIPGFPLYARSGELRNYDRYAAACHWHPDLEFLLVLDGSMDYFVNGRHLHMEAGEGIFVNSKRLHYGYSKDNTDCSFLVVVVHPSLLGVETSVGKEYFDLKFDSEAEDCILLTDHLGWQGEATKTIRLVYEEMHLDTMNPLRLISHITSLCANVSEHIKAISSQQTNKHEWLAVWNMTGYIQSNYAHKITLSDIATAGSVCRSKCCILFGKYIGQTPNAYLIQYRIGKSGEMLRETNMSILEIALNCGFQNPSYFTQVFHKNIGVTPREYRDCTTLNPKITNIR